MSFTNPRPPAPSGCVGTIDSSSRAMRFSSTNTRARRHSQAASSTPKIGRLTYMNHQPPNPSPPASPLAAHFASCPASDPAATRLQDRPGDDEHGDHHPGEGPVAQAGDVSDDADEGPPLRGRDHTRSQEVGNQRRAHPVRHGLAQDERRNGQQEADVHAEVHEQRLLDAARQHPARVERPGHEGQPREQGEEHGPANDAEARARGPAPRCRWSRSATSSTRDSVERRIGRLRAHDGLGLRAT